MRWRAAASGGRRGEDIVKEVKVMWRVRKERERETQSCIMGSDVDLYMRGYNAEVPHVIRSLVTESDYVNRPVMIGLGVVIRAMIGQTVNHVKQDKYSVIGVINDD